MEFLLIIVMVCGNVDSYTLYNKTLDTYYNNIKPRQIMKLITPERTKIIEIKQKGVCG